jgi:hypothetical protein
MCPAKSRACRPATQKVRWRCFTLPCIHCRGAAFQCLFLAIYPWKARQGKAAPAVLIFSPSLDLNPVCPPQILSAASTSLHLSCRDMARILLHQVEVFAGIYPRQASRCWDIAHPSPVYPSEEHRRQTLPLQGMLSSRPSAENARTLLRRPSALFTPVT